MSITYGIRHLLYIAPTFGFNNANVIHPDRRCRDLISCLPGVGSDLNSGYYAGQQDAVS